MSHEPENIDRERELAGGGPGPDQGSGANPGAKWPFTKGRGAPKGNKNALKHGFYSRALEAEFKAALAEAGEVEGLEAEIALLRAKLRDAIAADPQNLKVIIRATEAIARLLKVQERLSSGQKNKILEAATEVISSVAGPLLGHFLT